MSTTRKEFCNGCAPSDVPGHGTSLGARRILYGIRRVVASVRTAAHQGQGSRVVLVDRLAHLSGPSYRRSGGRCISSHIVHPLYRRVVHDVYRSIRSSSVRHRAHGVALRTAPIEYPLYSIGAFLYHNNSVCITEISLLPSLQVLF